MIQRFNNDSRIYFKHNPDDITLTSALNKLLIQHNKMVLFIDSIIIKNMSYDRDRFNFLGFFCIVLLLTLFINVLWQKKRLNNVYQDILFLYSIDSDRKNKCKLIIVCSSNNIIGLLVERDSIGDFFEYLLCKVLCKCSF